MGGLWGGGRIGRGPAVGLCCGSQLALSAADLHDGRWRLRASHSETVADDPDVRKRALSRWVSRERLRRCPAVLTLAPGTYHLTKMERPPVPDGELAAAVRWRLREVLDYPLEEAVTDVFEVPAQGAAGRSPLVYVVAARADPLRELVALARAAGLRPWKIDVAELALRNLMECDEAGAATVAAIYLMPDRGIVQITRGDVLYLSRNLEYGLEALARADLHEQVALELQRTMDYYDSHFGAAPVKHLLVMPGGEVSSGLAESVGGSLGLAARVWQAGRHMAADARSPELTSDALLALGGALNPAGGHA
jgi:MSHA biogenesis protein MshI